MSALTEKEIEIFNAGRTVGNVSTICYAPSLALNFEQNGHVTACCFNRTYVLGSYPQNTLSEIWKGEPIAALREALKKNDLSLGCQNCEKMIREGNFESVLIKHFDDYY